MVALARRPEESVAFLRSRLPDTPVDETTYKRLLAELDDQVLHAREVAQVALVNFGPVAGKLIRRTLENPPSLEVKRGCPRCSKKLAIPDSERNSLAANQRAARTDRHPGGGRVARFDSQILGCRNLRRRRPVT